jgi:hypothetical protein
VHKDVDTGQSTGCFLIFYCGDVVDHSSNMPGPVALISAEAEYNQACITTMALMHISMAVNNLELVDEDTREWVYLSFWTVVVPFLLDVHSVIPSIRGI